jgi:PAS domain S-box-containing protein
MPNGVSRAAIEVLLDRVNQGVSILSPEGRITYANHRLGAMLGLARMQVVGKPLADLVAQADREALALALANGRDLASQCRVALQRPNGAGDLPVLLTFAPLGHGQASCLVTEEPQLKPA